MRAYFEGLLLEKTFQQGCFSQLKFLLFLFLCGQYLREADAILSSDKPCFCRIAGTVDECSCSVDSVDEFNNMRLYPLLTDLLQRDFFRYYKVNMHKSCRFWDDDEHCSAEGSCGIEHCDERVPAGLKSNNNNNVVSERREGWCPSDNAFDPLDETISDSQNAAFQEWAAHDDLEDKYCDVDDEESSEMHYVDLLLNPERYTGYKGQSAARVWKAIYQENCFKPSPKYDKNFLVNPKITGLCLEKRVFYRLISGFHTSITVQVCAHHYTKPAGGFGVGTWKPNVEMFRWRFSEETTNGEGPERLKNMYFAFCLELRALQKVMPYLHKELFFTGNDTEDSITRDMIQDVSGIVNEFQPHFDEKQLFRGSHALELKEEFRQHFLNVSRIMDCVGCDKCRLWGYVHTHGMGTALKILFSDIPNAQLQHRFKLTRNDIVALFNSLGRYASSIMELTKFRSLLKL